MTSPARLTDHAKQPLIKVDVLADRGRLRSPTALNLAWSLVFFGRRDPGAGFVVIVLLWAAIVATIAEFWRTRRLAAALLLPYLAWVTFATILNAEIWRLSD